MGCIPIINLIVPLMGVNFYTCVRNFRATGQKMSLGELFDFSHILDKIVGPIVVGIFIAIGYFCLSYTGCNPNMHVGIHSMYSGRQSRTVIFQGDERIQKVGQR